MSSCLHSPFRLFGAVLGLSLAAASAHAQATTINMCIGSVSTNLLTSSNSDCTYADASQLYSITFGASQPAGPTGLPNGKPAVSQVIFQKSLNPSSMMLSRNLLSGATIDSLAIGINTVGPNNTMVNTTLRLTGVLVTSVSSSVYAGESSPTESISLSYQKIEIVDNSTNPATIVTWLAN